MTVNPGELKVLDNVLPSFLATTNAGGAVHVTTPIPSSLVVAGHTYDLTATGTKGQYIQAVSPTEAAGKGDRDLQILQVDRPVDHHRRRGERAVGPPAGNAKRPRDAKLTDVACRNAAIHRRARIRVVEVGLWPIHARR